MFKREVKKGRDIRMFCDLIKACDVFNQILSLFDVFNEQIYRGMGMATPLGLISVYETISLILLMSTSFKTA